MKLRTIRIDWISFMLLLVTAPLRAQDSVVTTLADSGPGSLREAIGPGRFSGTITFDPSLAGGTILMGLGSSPYQKIMNNTGFTIDASALPGGITIDANTSVSSRRRIFELGEMSLSSPGLTLIGITLVGGWAEDGVDSTSPEVNASSGEVGGAIFSQGNLTLVDCIIRGNRSGQGGRGTATGFTGSGRPGGDGGAIYCLRGNLSLLRCTFADNRAGDGGNGIPTNPSGDAFGGDGGDGGALYIDVGTTRNVSITKCIFTNNAAGRGATGGNSGGNGGSGGAIYSRGPLIITDCRIAANRSGNGGGGGDGGDGGDGGGIYASAFGSARTSIVTSSIENNASGSGGPGGSIEAGGGAGDAGRGGGIYCRMSIDLDQSTIAGNVTGDGGLPNPGTSSSGDGGAGGGIFCDGASSVFGNSLFVGNRTGSGGTSARAGSGGNGGALYNDDGLAISNCTFVNNATGNGGDELGATGFGFAQGAGRGGAVYNTSDLVIRSCTITGNSLGIDGTGSRVLTPTAGLSIWTPNDKATLNNSIATGSISGSLTAPSGNNFTSGDPALLPLGDYGGATFSRPPMDGSPVVDPAGGATTSPSAADQRGFTRVVGGLLDIGAAEFQGATGEFRLTFSLDSDRDGYSNGIEAAIGTDWLVADQGHPNRLAIPSRARLTFGFNPAMANLINLRLMRGSSLTNFDTAIPYTPSGSSVIATDGAAPIAAFYRLEATLR